MMKKILILAAVLALSSACAKHSEIVPTEGLPIDFGTWTGTMTKAAKTEFATNDEFDVYGFKWKTGPIDPLDVFTGDDVKYNGSTWSYSPVRIWDQSYDNYTFFAVFPKDQLGDEAAEHDYAQRGLFISNELTYNGSNEVLLVAQQKTVAKANYNATVPLVFKHVGSWLDIKVKKHADLESVAVTVTDFALSNIQTKGKFTVASYDGSDNPVGKTVSDVAGLGWDLAASPVVNDDDAIPYKITSSVVMNAGDDCAALDLLTNLILMPQVLTTGGGSQTLTISYTIQDGSGQTFTYNDKSYELRLFDNIDDEDNEDTLITKWMPGVHYTYYITINANTIQFSATIAPWGTDTGYHYLIN